MEPVEVIRDVFQFNEPDRVPYWFMADPVIKERLTNHYGSPAWEERVVPYFMGGHSVGGRRYPRGENFFVDDFGTVSRYNDKMLEPVEFPIKDVDDLQTYNWPSAESLCDWDELAEQFRRQRDPFAFAVCVLVFLNGPGACGE